MDETKKFWGLLRRRQLLAPTWRGWLLLIALAALLLSVVVHHLHPFLAVNQPLPGGGLLVVEGWATDSTLESVLAEFRRNHYEKVYATGGPIEWGAPLSEYKTYAERSAAVLVKLGLSTNEVQAVPAPRVRRDRTYSSALSLKAWLRQHGVATARIQLLTEGPHARRSRLLFEKAFGPPYEIGIIAIEVQDYDPQHWWRSSAGVRTVLDETFAYLYARLLFHPKD